MFAEDIPLLDEAFAMCLLSRMRMFREVNKSLLPKGISNVKHFMISARILSAGKKIFYTEKYTCH